MAVHAVEVYILAGFCHSQLGIMIVIARLGFGTTVASALAGKFFPSASALVFGCMTLSVSHFVDKVWMRRRIDFWQHPCEEPPHASQSKVCEFLRKETHDVDIRPVSVSMGLSILVTAADC